MDGKVIGLLVPVVMIAGLEAVLQYVLQLCKRGPNNITNTNLLTLNS